MLVVLHTCNIKNVAVIFGFAYNITRNQDLRFCSRIRDVFSFQQQQHSIAFMLLDLGGHWDVSFLPEVIVQI